jgi:hypothetical protein
MIDVGGGNGYTSHFLVQNGIHVALFEPGIMGCRNAIQRGMRDIVCSVFDENTVKSNSVESVGVFDVLEHIDDDRSFLETINHILIDDGMIYITVPAHQSLWSYSDNLGHFRRYSRKQLQMIVESAGFQIVSDSFFFWFLPIPIFLFRAIPDRFCRNRTKEPSSLKLNTSEFILPKIVNKFIDMILSGEMCRISNNKRVPIGASIFMVAMKSVKI